MAWTEDKAKERIRRFMRSVPQGNIVVEDFRAYLTGRSLAKGFTIDAAAQASLINIPRNRAISTNGVHIYANLVDFNAVLTDAGRETEASHRRALQFLHAHFSACDALIHEFELQRVDYHGARLHAVVLSPEGRENEGRRVEIAIAFAAAFRKMVERLGQDHPEFATGVRIGIDSGPAVAIDSGRSDERDPLFIGSPANHAAKLADGDEEGLTLSPRAAAAASQTPEPYKTNVVLSRDVEKRYLDDRLTTGITHRSGSERVDAAYDSLNALLKARKAPGASETIFHFHRKDPPLKDLVYAEHPPSNAIRMEVASIFADIDNFTAYIDNAIETGLIAEAVANLHVIRAEMGAVLRDDFGGRKVRYVGDCIHGLIAEGDRAQTNQIATMKAAVNAAAGLRSSFELCLEMLPGISSLGLAIGIDYGTTPICRLGLRGEASVRTATSRASCVSEAEQKRCDGTETALGDYAYRASPASIREVFSADRKVGNLNVDSAAVLFDTMPSPYVATGVEPVPMRAHSPDDTPPMRAHGQR